MAKTCVGLSFWNIDQDSVKNVIFKWNRYQ